MINTLVRFIDRVKNLIRWFPVIWDDHDWDDYYIYKILQFKLKNQAKYIGGNDFHTRAKRDAEKMMTCVRLIDKMTDEYYQMEYFEYYDIDIMTKGAFNFTVTKDELDQYYVKYPLTFKKVVAQYGDDRDKATIAMLMGLERQQKARKLLFKILEQNIEGWWA